MAENRAGEKKKSEPLQIVTVTKMRRLTGVTVTGVTVVCLNGATATVVTDIFVTTTVVTVSFFNGFVCNGLTLATDVYN